ncbi:nuclear protein qri2 [Sporothrix brasiliensis 5110]|uniref:Non-structural maintenance of chromosomes element 4 n=1 Tax=Sporothrix brasiliensis 5110 TaxID=1398154 RepID=A0A0C2F9E3_9PEZI|nr:nuclear protein qri2 [Sporothrix brasiliensis 5110]KIH87668.1 nuclear protein qri2 [Sporothrix brasiliensis 5110]
MVHRGKDGQSSASGSNGVGSASRSSRAERAERSEPRSAPVDLSLSQAEDVQWDEVGYDDDVDAHEAAAHRRMLQREMRGLIKQTTTDQAAFYDQDSHAVHDLLNESSHLLRQTRQTTEATIDATLVLRVSELAFKRTTNFLAERQDHTGIDLEDFATRCQDYMRLGRGIKNMHARELSRSQRKRRRGEALAHADDGARRAIRDARARAQAARTAARSAARAAAARTAAATGAEAVVDELYDMSDDSGSSGDDVDDDDDDAAEDEAGGAVQRNRRAAWEPLDWEHFGRYACLPRTRRPALARFLPRMAPADGDDKARVQRKRTAALRLAELREVRPQVLQADELAATKKSDNILTTLATDILQQLRRAVARGAELVRRIQAAGLDEDDNEDGDEPGSAMAAAMQQLLEQVGIHSNGGVDLIRFAVNPLSFSQTVENLFYISFLVRDGRAGLAYDHTGLPSIFPTEAEDGGGERVQAMNEEGGGGRDERELGGGRRRGKKSRNSVHDDEAGENGGSAPEDTQRHQLILAIDMAMWKEMIELFNITKPMIEHRESAEPSHPSGQTWFT